MYINSRIKRNQKNSWIQIFIKIRWKRKEKQKKKTKQTQSIIVMSLRYITSTSNALPTVPRCRLPTGHRSLEAALALRKNKKKTDENILLTFLTMCITQQQLQQYVRKLPPSFSL